MSDKIVNQRQLHDKQKEILKQKKEQQEKIKDEMYKMVMRQTEYNYEEAKQKVIENNYNYVEVIQNYLGKTKEKKQPKTVNQKIYKEIRSFMDYGSEKYEYNKKQQQKMLEYREKLQEEAKRRGLTIPQINNASNKKDKNN